MHTTQTNLLWSIRDSQNREAWGQFYRLYAPMIRHFTRRLGLAEPDTEDLSQEVLMIAQRAMRDGRYDPAKGSFRTYLYGIARRQALAALRARRRRTRIQAPAIESGADLIEELEDRRGEETAREIWRQEWRFAVLEEALRHVRADLGEKPFAAFTLLAIEHRPVDQVARQLGIAPASVYVYKSRVLEAVREWVGRFEDEPPDSGA